MRSAQALGCSGWGRADLIRRARRQRVAARDEYLAGHDRPQPGADGGEGGGHRRSTSWWCAFWSWRMWDNHRLLNGIASALFAVGGAAARSMRVRRGDRAPADLSAARAGGRAAGSRTPRTTRCKQIVARELQGQLLHARSGAGARGVREAAMGAQGQRAPAMARSAARSRSRSTCALARWRDTALVNSYGEVFRGGEQRRRCRCSSGPAGTAPEVCRSNTQSFGAVLGALSASCPWSCVLSDRGALAADARRRRACSSSGASSMDARLQRFVAAYRAHARHNCRRRGYASTCAIRTGSHVRHVRSCHACKRRMSRT